MKQRYGFPLHKRYLEFGRLDLVLKFGRLSRRLAISEVVGSVLAIAITIIAGSGVWSYINSQAAVTETALGKGVGSTTGYISEQMKVIDLYYGSSTSTTMWLLNTGSATLQLFRIRLYDSAGLINIQFNYTLSGPTKTDYVYDLRSSLASKCKTAASSYETPTISSYALKLLNAQSIQLTIPPVQLGCPSYGLLFVSGTTYTLVITGLNGNSVTYWQVK